MSAYGYVQLSLSKSWQVTASIGELRTEVWHGFAIHRSVEDSHHGTFRRSALCLLGVDSRYRQTQTQTTQH